MEWAPERYNNVGNAVGVMRLRRRHCTRLRDWEALCTCLAGTARKPGNLVICMTRHVHDLPN